MDRRCRLSRLRRPTGLASKPLTEMAERHLFDPVQRHAGQGRYSESHFAYLNRADGSAWQRIRDLHEEWYSDYPDAAGDLRARFRESDIRQHAPAWWELYTHALFRRLGYTVEVHPELAGTSRRPDMLVARGDSRMYVECVVLFEDGSDPGSDGQAWLRDCIDSAKHPDLIVGVGIRARGSQRPREREVTKRIEEWLNSLNYDDVHDAHAAHAGLPTETFDFRGWRVVLTALPMAPHRRGVDCGRIAYGPSTGMFVVTAVDGIRRVLEKKASQCRGVDSPLVIAMLSRAVFARQHELARACFGSDAIKLDETGSAAELVQQADGYWRPQPHPHGRRVSAVLFSEHLHASRIAAELPTLWVNPWANNPIADQLPFETRTAHNTGHVFLASEGTSSPAEAFGLPTDWPYL